LQPDIWLAKGEGIHGLLRMSLNKPAYTINDRIALLKQRGMLFRNTEKAHSLLKNINYYRLKGYWWNIKTDFHVLEFHLLTKKYIFLRYEK
jgi:abortive infection bacteriophage resistance protein